jgi:hypothetical protein
MVYETDDISSIPQVWAMYKEVMGYFANGMTVPEDGEWSERGMWYDDAILTVKLSNCWPRITGVTLLPFCRGATIILLEVEFTTTPTVSFHLTKL